jgi:hypothetical protein
MFHGAAHAPPLQDRCDGCTHNWYAAPCGQAHNPAPHSRCLFFARDIRMLMDKDRWYGSAIPPGCPTFAQKAFDFTTTRAARA